VRRPNARNAWQTDNVSFGRAWRTRSKASDQDLAHYLYVDEDPIRWCVLLCNSYEIAWSAGWGTVGARLCRELFAKGWTDADGEPSQRLDVATAQLIDGFCKQSAAVWHDDEGFEGVASATFLAAARGSDGTIHLRWIGGEFCVLVRARAAIRRTAPHNLQTEFEKVVGEAKQIPHGDVITRSVAPPEDRCVVDSAVWSDCEVGDHLIIGSGTLLEHATPTELAAMIKPGLSASAHAERIIKTIAKRGQPWGVAVCIVAL